MRDDERGRGAEGARERDDEQRSGQQPSDAEELVGDTAASEPLSDRNPVQPGAAESRDRLGTATETGPPPHSDETRGGGRRDLDAGQTSGAGEESGAGGRDHDVRQEGPRGE